jgi:hypothetical protein
VGGRNDIFQFLVGEDINGGEVAFSMTVLTSLGGRYINNLNIICKRFKTYKLVEIYLAWSALDHNVSIKHIK